MVYKIAHDPDHVWLSDIAIFDGKEFTHEVHFKLSGKNLTHTFKYIEFISLKYISVNKCFN